MKGATFIKIKNIIMNLKSNNEIISYYNNVAYYLLHLRDSDQRELRCSRR